MATKEEYIDFPPQKKTFHVIKVIKIYKIFIMNMRNMIIRISDN